MAGRRDIEDQLNQLRSEIETLVDLPVLSPEFVTWLGMLYAVVEAGFGVNSDEMRELRAISPELPSEVYDSFEKRIDSLGLNEEHRNQLVTKLHTDMPRAIFRHRLRDYDELIGAMIYGLRRP